MYKELILPIASPCHVRLFSRFMLLFLLGASIRVAAAEDFCALSVDLVFHDGTPAKLQPVRLLDPAGNTVFDQQPGDSTVRICDFGFGPHKLVVGYKFCYPVT